MKSSIALAALVVASLGLGAIAPALAANTSSSTPAAATSAPAKPDANRPMRANRMGELPGPAFGRTEMFLSVVCSDKGAEFLDKAFTRAAKRLDLTTGQTKLFDTLKTTALTSQTNFADSCAAARPDTAADAKLDLLGRMKAHLTIEEARVAALTAVLPDFEAFYTSLSDEQKAKLQPHGKGGMGGMGEKGGMGRMDRPGRGPQPGRG